MFTVAMARIDTPKAWAISEQVSPARTTCSRGCREASEVGVTVSIGLAVAGAAWIAAMVGDSSSGAGVASAAMGGSRRKMDTTSNKTIAERLIMAAIQTQGSAVRSGRGGGGAGAAGGGAARR